MAFVESPHTGDPVSQRTVPLTQLLVLPVHPLPATHAMQLPLPLQTCPAPHGVPPSTASGPSTQTAAPVEQAMTPRRHAFPFPEQPAPAEQPRQVPAPSHTKLAPHVVPAGRSAAPFTHACAPVAHDVTPALQGLGFDAHAWPALQATQAPLPSHTNPGPQPVPAGTFAGESTQACAPPPHEVTPTLHGVGLEPQVWPAVQATQAPEAVHTRFDPQAVPAATFTLESPQTGLPDAQPSAPTRQGFGFDAQAIPATQAMQLPAPSQTSFVPHVVPAPALTWASMQDGLPVAHDVMPPLHRFGFVLHASPATQAVQAPSRHTRLAPQAAPLAAFVPVSVQVAASGVQVKVPRWQRFGGWHAWPCAQGTTH